MLLVRAAQWVVVTLVVICLLVVLLSFSGILASAGARLADARAAQRAGRNAAAALTPSPDMQTPLVRPLAGASATRAAALQALVESRPSLSNAVDALLASGLVEQLPAQATLLLPGNDAFSALPSEAWQMLQANPDRLADLLAYHTLTMTLPANEIGGQTKLPTLLGPALPVANLDGSVRIGSGRITAYGLEVDDGALLVHEMDHVQIPPGAVQAPVIDMPDNARAATLAGDYLTAVGSGAPGKLLVLQSNGATFGRALVDSTGRWAISGAIGPGSYELIAYLLETDDQLLAASTPIALTVTAP